MNLIKLEIEAVSHGWIIKAHYAAYMMQSKVDIHACETQKSMARRFAELSAKLVKA